MRGVTGPAQSITWEYGALRGGPAKDSRTQQKSEGKAYVQCTQRLTRVSSNT